jgi:hypothetical protein
LAWVHLNSRVEHLGPSIFCSLMFCLYYSNTFYENTANTLCLIGSQMCNNLATGGFILQFKWDNNLEGCSVLGVFAWMATCSGLSLSLSLSPSLSIYLSIPCLCMCELAKFERVGNKFVRYTDCWSIGIWSVHILI